MLSVKNRINSFLLLLLLVQFSCITDKKAETGSLLRVETLHNNEAAYRLIALQDKDEYESKHLEGAINISRADLESKAYPYKGMVAAANEVEMLFSKLGIKPEDNIVIYDNKGDVDAARLWWMLAKYGHKGRVSLLDGGLKAWEKKGFPVTTKPVALPASNYTFQGVPSEDNTAMLEEVKGALGDTNVIILDCRSLEENTGQEMKKGATRAGKIPGARWVNYTEAIQDTGDAAFCFKNAAALRKLYTEKGITGNKEIIVYCHSGVRSSHTTFVLTELLGYKNVKNYAGSWVEWSYFKELPVE